MRHQNIDPQQSLMIYTYKFEVAPSALSWIISPIVEWVFNWQTRRRFARLRDFLALHASDVEHWQLAEAAKSATRPLE